MDCGHVHCTAAAKESCERRKHRSELVRRAQRHGWFITEESWERDIIIILTDICCWRIAVIDGRWQSGVKIRRERNR